MKLHEHSLKARSGDALRGAAIEWLAADAGKLLAVGCLKLTFADGAQYSISCRGDGGLFIAGAPTKRLPPGIQRETTRIDSLCGVLRSIDVDGPVLEMVVAGRTLRAVNVDDELDIFVDGTLVTGAADIGVWED